MATHVRLPIRAAAMACLLFAAGAYAAPIGDNPKPESAAEKVKKALDTVINVDLDQTTFGSALDHIRDKTKLNIVVDKQPFLNQGIVPEELQVNIKLKDVKAKTALKLLIAQLPQVQDWDPVTGRPLPGGMTYVIDDDIVYITFEHRAARRQMSQKVSIDVEKAAVDVVLKQMAKDTGVNIVLDPRHVSKVKDPVTISLNQVGVETAVRLVAEMAGLGSVKMGNVLFVTSKEVAAELRKEEQGPIPEQWQQFWRNLGIPLPVPGCGFGGPGGIQIMPAKPGIVDPAVPVPFDPPLEKNAKPDAPAPEKPPVNDK